MRSILLCAVGALSLAACQQPSTPAEPEAPAAADTATETAAPASTASPASSDAGTAAPAAGDASVDTAGAAPANDGGMMDGPSPATRDGAKEKAEQTNLHPRTP